MLRRIVIFSAFLSPLRSGAEACAEEVALRLASPSEARSGQAPGDRGFDITIITAKMRKDLPREDLLQGKVRIIRVGFGMTFDKWLYPLLAPFAARKLKPDIIHAVLETFAGVALHMCKAVYPRAKQILTLQTTNRNFLRGHILRTPTVVTAISRHLADQAKKLGRSDVIVLPNGIPYAEIRRACEKTKKIPGRILFVGRLEQMKGVDTLLKAFSSLATRNPQPATADLHIVGSGSLRSSLENLAKGNACFLGQLFDQDLHREYSEAEIFCGLSRSEALGNVFLEAQAAGCAVLATEIGGIPEVVKDGVTGILTEPDNPELAADVIAELLRNEQLRRTLTTAAVEHAKSFDWDAIAERYGQIYDGLR